MSTIETLGILGIRSYSPDVQEVLHFSKPLTLIQGENGAGKTTIIECLKMATCGSLPPNAENGKRFLCDPKVIERPEVLGQIKLKFYALNKRPILSVRSFKVTANIKKHSFAKTEQVLKTRTDTGETICISHTCAEIDKQVPELLGVSKAVLEYVILCHQEESLWPFSDNQTLKKIFDDLFDTSSYSKMLDTLMDHQKEYKKKVKENKEKLIVYKKNYENLLDVSSSTSNSSLNAKLGNQHLLIG